MKNKLLYPILMLYSCAQFSKVDVYSPNLDDVCPKIGSEMKVELKLFLLKRILILKMRSYLPNMNLIKLGKLLRIYNLKKK